MRLALPAFLLLAGCLAPPPPVLVQGHFVPVRAEDEATAALVAGYVDELVPRVRTELAGSAEVPLEVWVQEDPRLYDLPGAGSGDSGFYTPTHQRIHVKAALVHGSPGRARFMLAHELTHALRDEVWARLDPALEEGLADDIAARVAPDAAPMVAAQRLVALLPQGLGITISFAKGLPTALVSLTLARPESGFAENLLEHGQVESEDYGRAFVVLRQLDERDGLAGLRATCAAATEEDSVTLEQAARMAGVELGDPAMADLAVASIDDATLRAMLEGVSKDIGSWLASCVPRGGEGAEADLRAAAPTAIVTGGTARVATADVPGVLEAFLKARVTQAGQAAATP